MTNEVSKDSAPSFELTADGSFIRHRNVLFEEDEYVINIGPQHPATHGVLRFRVSLEARSSASSTCIAVTSTAASRRCAKA